MNTTSHTTTTTITTTMATTNTTTATTLTQIRCSIMQTAMVPGTRERTGKKYSGQIF